MDRDFTVARRGTDTSGRAILATAFFWQVWTAALGDERLRAFAWKVVVVQGAFMSRLGGGASASAGYHDLAGCWDVRTWNLTSTEQQLLWDVMAEYGIWFWKRDYPAHMGGMDPHGHAVAGWDAPLASGAAYQWTQAKTGRNGLANNAPDYMRRNGPLVLFPPDRLLQEDYMSTTAAEQKLDRALGLLEDLGKSTSRLSSDERRRFQAQKEWKGRLVGEIGGVADQLNAIAGQIKDDASSKEVRQAVKRLLTALVEDPDVDGADNPDPQAVDELDQPIQTEETP